MTTTICPVCGNNDWIEVTGGIFGILCCQWCSYVPQSSKPPEPRAPEVPVGISANATLVKECRFQTVADLIEQLQRIPNPHTTYAYDPQSDDLRGFYVEESTLTDGSKVYSLTFQTADEVDELTPEEARR